DLRRGLGEASVEEDVALRRGDEERGHLRRSDRVDVGHHLERLAWRRPGVRLRCGEQEEQGSDHGCALAALVPPLPTSVARKICQVRSVSSAVLSWKSSLGSPGCCGSLGSDVADAGTTDAMASSALKWLGRFRSRGESSSALAAGPGSWRT